MTPTEFCVRVLGIVPYLWQCEAMESVAMEQPTSVVAANGSGKTARLVAPLVLWFLHEFPRGQCIFTSGSWMQIEKQLWGAVKVYQHRFPHWRFMSEELRTPEGGYAFGFSTDNPGRAEGHHPKIGGDVDPVFLIIDEAKTVPDSIFEAFDRCTRKMELWVSSPGAPRGQFYDSFHKNSSLYKTIRVPSTDCAHISAEKRELDRIKYGESHPLYRSKHLAEFTEDFDRLVLAPDLLRNALDAQPKPNAHGEIIAFCDFAAGRDENVLAIRRGNHARIVRAWQERDTVQAAREFIQMFQAEGLTAGQIWGDADGLGTGFCDQFAEMGWHINRFHGGKPPSEKDEYANLIAQVWHVASREIERGRIHVGELDPTTFSQITTRKSEWNETGKLRVESKEKMAAKSMKSPDRADALLACIALGSRITGAMTGAASVTTSRNTFASRTVRGFNAL